MALNYYTEEELAIMFPSSPPLSKMGEIPSYKGRVGECMAYETVYGTGEISPLGLVEYGTLSINGHHFTIMGNDMRVHWYYTGTTKYKEYTTTEGFLSIMGYKLCNNKVELNVSEFVNKLKADKRDSFYVRQFKVRVLEILREKGEIE